MVVTVAKMVSVYVIMFGWINPIKHIAFSFIDIQSIMCFMGIGFHRNCKDDTTLLTKKYNSLVVSCINFFSR